MPLNFPAKPDVQLGNSPLVEVVCQVKFPAILRIASKEPSDFQDRIRDQFPNFEQEVGVLFRPLGSQKDDALEVPIKTYRFRTIDRQSAISLSSDFYALSTTRYTHWNEFTEKLNLVHEAVMQVYKPAYAVRIGLRYINRITSTNTKVNTLTELFTVLRPELTAHARNEVWGDAAEMNSRLLLKDAAASLTLNTAYGSEGGEPVFILDFDYFEEGELPLNDLIERSSRYHEVIYRAFRWSILDDKLAVFEPKAKDA